MIKSILRKYLPIPIKNILRKIKQNTIDQYRKKKLVKKMTVKHIALLEKLKDRTKIRVVFLAIHKSVWKVDPVFKKMLDDPYFDPVILVCPYTIYGEEQMWKDMEEAYQYFTEKSYPVISAYKMDTDQWITLDELDTDIVFFTNPHNLTRKEYYEDAYLNYLSCYVPYHHEVGSYDNDIGQYGNYFQASLWRFYASNTSALKQYNHFYSNKPGSAKTIGYPAMIDIITKYQSKTYKNVWKNQDGRLKIIWAPHHSIDMEQILPYSSFLQHSTLMQEFAQKYQDNITWCFKPHPLLKIKLYNHKEWGKKRTDEYYDYWDSQEFSQINLSEYNDLFCSSDAIIHDCGSFLAEYLYLKKPALFLISKDNDLTYYNNFGRKALASYQLANSHQDIENFLQQLINNENLIQKNHLKFLDEEIYPYFKEKNTPDIQIIEDIKNALK